MSTLQGLPGIGKVTEKLLIEVGVDTPDKLINVGSRGAFLKIRQVDPTACLHMLYGLEGAVQGMKDSQLNTETKQDLKEFFAGL